MMLTVESTNTTDVYTRSFDDKGMSLHIRENGNTISTIVITIADVTKLPTRVALLLSQLERSDKEQAA